LRGKGVENAALVTCDRLDIVRLLSTVEDLNIVAVHTALEIYEHRSFYINELNFTDEEHLGCGRWK